MTHTPEPSSRPLVVGIGEVLWDLLPSGKQLGGAPANFAYHAQQLGARGAVVSAVGKDALGDELLARLRELGLDTRHVTADWRRPTGTVSVTLDAAGVPSYVIHEKVAWDALVFNAALRDLARSADVMCFGTLAQRTATSRDCISDTLDQSPGICIFDINLRQHYYSRDVIESSLIEAPVMKINDEELAVVARLFDLSGPADLLRMLFDRYEMGLIAVTRGGRGSILYPQDGEPLEHPGVPVTNLVDTVGAGDAFTAALAIGLLRNEPLDRVNAAANRLAAYVCSQPGATPAIPPELLATLWSDA